MKNLLIICDNFPPQSGPRMGYLVKYAKRLGWNSYVVAAENKSRNDLTGLSGYAVETHIVPQKPHRKWNLLHMLPFFWPYDYLRGEYDMRRIALELAHRIKFDLVLCTHTYGYFPLSVAYAVARAARLPLVIDIRDLGAQNPRVPFWQLPFSTKMDRMRGFLSYISNRRGMRMHRSAAVLTTISPWHAEWLKRWNKNSVCIYNGFDPELFKPVVPQKVDRFEVIYTGTLGEPRCRDFELLIQAVQHLDMGGKIVPSAFRVLFYCGTITPTNNIRERISELAIERYFEFLPFVPLSEVPRLYERASCLLLLSAKSGPNGTHGVMTTKFYEYLAANRPILCVRSDEECLESAIKETNAGCAARTVEEAESYLLALYHEWQTSGITNGTTKGTKLSLYSRATQAKQFIELFNSISHRKDGDSMR